MINLPPHLRSLLETDVPRFSAGEMARRREQAPVTFEAFAALEAMEESTDPNAQQLGATIRLADRVLGNGGTKEALHAKVASLLEELDG